MVNGFCQSTIVVDGFSMVFFTCEPLVSMVFQWFFFMWTIGVNGFSMVFYMWTIGVNGFSMVLGKVKAGSQKKPKNKKKHDLFNKYLGVNNL